MAYENAVQYCESRSMVLVIIDCLYTNVWLEFILLPLICGQFIQNIVQEFAIANNLQSYWINGNDILQESRWVDSNKYELPYRSVLFIW